MTEQQEIDLDTMRGAFGLYVAQLTPFEAEAFNRLCEDGIASRDYCGVSGAFGLSKATLNAKTQGLRGAAL